MAKDTRDAQIDDIADNMILSIPALYRRIIRLETESDKNTTYTFRVWVLMILKIKGPSPITLVADRICYSKQNMTTLIDNLERGGLLVRVNDAFDRRVTNISITKEGEKFLKDSKVRFRNKIRKDLSNLPDEDVEELFHSLMTLRRLLPNILIERRDSE
jgi:DNA-binding MarR family transcriptional regulator